MGLTEMDHCQIAISKAIEHIRYNKLPLQYKVIGDHLEIDCSGWDINEIDHFVMIMQGKRNEFIIKIPSGPHSNHIDIYSI